MAARNWIFGSATESLEKNFRLSEKDLLVISEKKHNKIAQHQETKAVHTRSSNGNKITNVLRNLQMNLKYLIDKDFLVKDVIKKLLKLELLQEELISV